MKLRNLGLIGALTLVLSPAAAQAQGDFKDNVTKLIKKVGFHASTSFADPLDATKTQRDGSYGFSVGLAPGQDNGWRYPVGLAWFTEELRSPTGTSFTELASRPVVAGIGYGWHFGQLSTGASLQAGWAFNEDKPMGELGTAFGLPGTPISVDVGNAFVLRPQLRVEYFLTSKFTLRSSLNYIFMNPRVRITSPDRVITNERWNASNVSLSMGVGFYPFRK
jgi:hypothetical protein